MSIVKVVLEANKERPYQSAIQDELGLMTYFEFEKAVLNISQDLRSKGLREGMGVGVMDRNSRNFIIIIFAVMHTGAVAMPISNQLKTQELEAIFTSSGLHWLLDAGNGPESSLRDLDYFQIHSAKWKIKEHQKYNGVPFAGHVKDPAIIRYTSGTTGKAKGVIIGHQAINERIDSANKVLKLGVEDTVIWVLPMAYHFVVSIILFLKNGCTIALAKNFLGNTIFDCIRDCNGTFLYASPIHIKMLANYPTDEKLLSLKKVISTSTAISTAQCQSFYNKYHIPVSQAYGIIEIGLPIINFNNAEEHPDAVGHALPDYSVCILSDENEILTNGEVGNLGIKGPGMFAAYLKPPQLCCDILNDGYFMTGDLASMDRDGLIRIEGRKKSMINVSGNKVFPEEVEQVLSTHPDIKSCKISGFNHRLMGEMVHAEIVLMKNVEVEKEAILSYCRERLTTYKIPQRITFVEKITTTGSGKLKR